MDFSIANAFIGMTGLPRRLPGALSLPKGQRGPSEKEGDGFQCNDTGMAEVERRHKVHFLVMRECDAVLQRHDGVYRELNCIKLWRCCKTFTSAY